MFHHTACGTEHPMNSQKGLQCVKYSLLQYPREKKFQISEFFSIFFKNIFWSPVSRIVPKNVKRGLWEFSNIHSFAKQEKNEGDPLETLKSLRKKVSQSRKKPTQKFF